MPELTTKAWKCSYCNRCFMNKGIAANHESSCKKNPSRQHCATCIHGILKEPEIVEKDILTIEAYMPGYDPEKVLIHGPYCAYHKCMIAEKPYFFECETGYYGPDCTEYPLPGTCFNYEYKGHFGWTPEKDYLENNKEETYEDHQTIV